MHRDTATRTAILLNGEPTHTEAATLAEVATALNGDFVPRGARAATQLADGDKVEIVAPRQGG
jgi:sulfur carrier protein